MVCNDSFANSKLNAMTDRKLNATTRRGGHLSICAYIIRKEGRENSKKSKNFFQLFFKKLLTRGFFHAILHTSSTDNTVNTVKTVLSKKKKILPREVEMVCNL